MIKTRYFTPWEARRLITMANTADIHAAFTIGFATGLRVGELVRMKPLHWRWDQGYVEILDSKKVDPQLVRKVPFLEDEGAVVRRYIDVAGIGPDEAMFPKSDRTYTRAIQKAALAAGIHWDTSTHRVRWHSWRGTYVRFQRNFATPTKSDKWLMQTTGDSLEVLQSYYEELTTEDLVRIHRSE